MATEGIVKTRPAVAELLPDTKQLVERLSHVEEGETIKWEDLTAVIRRDVRGSAHGVLRSARRIMERDKEVIFGTVRGVGLKRLNALAGVAEAERQIVRSRRGAVRGAKTLSHVKYNELDASGRIYHGTTASMLGMLIYTTSKPQINKVEAAVRRANDTLAIGRVLEVLGNGKEPHA